MNHGKIFTIQIVVHQTPFAFTGKFMKWNKSTKIPRLYQQTETISFGSIRGVSQSVRVGVRRSKDVLLRSRHGKTHYRLGDEGWKDYPDSQAGRYKYVVGWYAIYDGDTKGWECESGDMADGWEWIPLENCVAAGYTW